MIAVSLDHSFVVGVIYEERSSQGPILQQYAAIVVRRTPLISKLYETLPVGKRHETVTDYNAVPFA